ncbi:hypothetical protein EMMF5_001555 [Cystobasidiomycetes sp. EMM_F5]
MSAFEATNPSVEIENVQPLHSGQVAVTLKAGASAIPQGHSEMGGKALLAKKMAASGNSFYSPTDTIVSPCTAKLHLAKKKHFTKGKPLALSSSFATSNNNPLNPSSQNVPLSNAGFLHPSHAKQAQSQLANQGLQSSKLQQVSASQDAHDENDNSACDDEEMEI